jgi:hypothetical protein
MDGRAFSPGFLFFLEWLTYDLLFFKSRFWRDQDFEIFSHSGLTSEHITFLYLLFRKKGDGIAVYPCFPFDDLDATFTANPFASAKAIQVDPCLLCGLD